MNRPQWPAQKYDGDLVDLIAESGRDALWQMTTRGCLAIDVQPPAPTPASWARILEALNKHHPEWIDGNGSTVDKVVKFIEATK